MKNKIVTLFTLILLLGILSACGNKDIPASKETPADTLVQTTSKETASESVALESTAFQKPEPVITVHIDSNKQTTPKNSILNIIRHGDENKTQHGYAVSKNGYIVEWANRAPQFYSVKIGDKDGIEVVIKTIAEYKEHSAMEAKLTGAELVPITMGGLEGIAWNNPFIDERGTFPPEYHRYYVLSDEYAVYFHADTGHDYDDNTLDEIFWLFEFVIENSPAETTEMQTTASQTTTAAPETTTTSDTTTAASP